MIFELAQDFGDAVAATPREHPKHRMLELLEEAIRRDIHFIARHPTTLFQCMWNTCWWYDCPEAAKHYEEPKGGWKEPPPWKREEWSLCLLLEKWRDERREKTPRSRWLRSLRPPFVHLGTAESMKLRGDERGAVSEVGLTRNGRRIVARSPNEASVWDAESGRKLFGLRLQQKRRVLPGFDAEGRRVATGSDDGTIEVWDVDSGSLLHCLHGHGDSVALPRFSPDGQLVVSASWDRTIRVWNAENGQEIRCLAVGGRSPETTAFSSSGRYMASWSESGIRIWDTRDWVASPPLRTGEDPLWSVCFSPDDGIVVAGSNDGTVRFWLLATRQELYRLRGSETGAVWHVSFSPDGRRLASRSEDKSIRIWDPQSGTELHCLRGKDDWNAGPDFVLGGRRIVAASVDGTIRVWDVEHGTELRCLLGHEAAVTSIGSHPTGRRIVSGSIDETIRVWDLESGVNLRQRRDPGGYVSHLQFPADGRSITTWTAECLRIWSTETGEELRRLGGHQRMTPSGYIALEGKRVVSGVGEGRIYVWDYETGEELCCFDHVSQIASRVSCCPDIHYAVRSVSGVMCSPDGRYIVSMSDTAPVGKIVCVWNVESGKLVLVLDHQLRPSKSLAFSPDGRFLAGEGKNHSVGIWEIESPVEPRVVGQHEGPIVCVNYDSSGRKMVSASWDRDKAVRIWSTERGGELACLRGHQGTVQDATFSPDGTRIVSYSTEEIIVWDVDRGKPQCKLSGHGRCIDDAEFSADGRQIISRAWDRRIEDQDYDTTVRIWDAETGNCLEVIKARCDLPSIAAGSARFPFRLQSDGLGSSVFAARTRTLIAPYPDAMDYIVTAPSGIAWAGATRKQLHIIALDYGRAP